MKDNFNQCLDFTLQYEGGYVNNPHDPGGPTNLGVTIVTLSHELGRRATIPEVRLLTAGSVTPIYRKKYWNLVDGDELPKGVDLMMFDISVNSGAGRADEWNRATGHLAPVERIKRLDELRCGFWRHLRSFPVFGRGWLRRESSCLSLALKMVQL